VQQSAILQSLGAISVRQFMGEYWQRRPLLIRNALRDFNAPVDRRRLFELARDPGVESRLVTAFDGRWSLQHGPFSRLPSARRRRWTLLVQGVDLHDDAARDLLSRFRFIPDARLDDLMVSYATDGGGVGPHVDSYDVFLLQAAGRRRWRISRQRNLRSKRDAPINVVEGFRASREWVLEAGDMLYLPPRVAHEGTAIGESLTYSIGFRAPTYQQLLEPWFADYAELAAPPGRYVDAGAPATGHPAALPPAMTRRIHAQLLQHKPRAADTERFLLRYLTEPKAATVFEPPPAISQAKFRSRAAGRGLALDRRSRMMYSSDGLAINGESIELPARSIAALKGFADARALSPQMSSRLPSNVWALLHDWYRAGWIAIAD
jgi:50S ribosomal protein L16 3-hydroxylase